MARKIIRKGKREWYSVLAPNIFKNREMGEILAYTPKELIGRCVELAYSEVAENSRDRSKHFTARITNVVEKKAQTEPVKIVYSAGFIQRLLKRYKTSELVVGNFETKDKKRVTAKLYLLANKNINKSIRTALIQKVKVLLKNKLIKSPSDQLFGVNYIESLGKELRSQLKVIYPLNNVVFWKVIVE